MTVVNQANIDLLSEAMQTGGAAGFYQPAVYVIEPTNRCNVNCIMCPNHQFTSDQLGDIELAVFSQVLDQISSSAELVMLYFLGESTLHPQFESIMKLARSKLKGRIVVSTNGFALSDDTIETIVNYADIVIGCIDRWNAELYNRIRVGSDFGKVVSTLEQMIRARGCRSSPQIIVKALDIHLPREASPDRYEQELEDFRRFWSERGATPLAGWLNSWAGQMRNLVKLTSKANPYSGKARPPCADLWFKMIINWKGEVVLCCLDWSSSVVLGKLTESTVDDVWQSAGLIKIRRDHLAGRFDQASTLCSSCSEWGEADELTSYIRLNADDLYKVF